MEVQKFVDCLALAFEQIEANFLETCTLKKPLPLKLDFLSMELLSFKCSILQSIGKFIKTLAETNSINPSRDATKLSNLTKSLDCEIQQTSYKVQKHRLHQILKQKLNKAQGQSQSQSQRSQTLSQLQTSLCLIQKDLGIEQYDNHTSSDNSMLFNSNDISAIVTRSMLAFECTPGKTGLRRESVTNIQSVESVESVESAQFLCSAPNSTMFLKQALKQTLPTPTPPTLLPNPTAKKQQTIKSNKIGLLDNLLEESYNSCQ